MKTASTPPPIARKCQSFQRRFGPVGLRPSSFPLVARPEQGRADPDMGGADHHRGLVIGRHAHARGRRRHDAAPAWRARRNRAPPRRRPAGCTSGRRPAASARRVEQGGQLGDRAAALLRLVADIDLDEAIGPPAGLGHRLGERGRPARAGRPNGSHRTGRPPPRPCSTGAGRSDGGGCRDGARAAPAIWPAPPAPDSRRNRAGPAAISASIASAGLGLGDGDQGHVVRPRARPAPPPWRSAPAPRPAMNPPWPLL